MAESNNPNSKKSDEEIVNDLEKILKEYGLDFDDQQPRHVPKNNATIDTQKIVRKKETVKANDVFTSTRNSINNKSVPPKTNRQNIKISRDPAPSEPLARVDVSKQVVIGNPSKNQADRNVIFDENSPNANHNVQRKNFVSPSASTKQKKSEHNFFRSFLPFKGDSAKEVIRKLAMDISAILVVVCFGIFINNYISHQNQIDNQRKIDNIQKETVDDTARQWEKIKEKYPNISFPDGMMIKFAELYAKNQDLVGWLKIDNTNIDTAVLHHPQDVKNNASEDFYLRHDLYGQSNKYGNVFLDRYNSGDKLDSNNVLYGHNMTDGLMFAQLEKYYTLDGYKDSPIVQYSTLYKDYYFKVYAAIITNGFPNGDNDYLFNYTTAFFPSDENFGKFIQAIDERALYKTGVDINEHDNLLVLSTCSYEIKKTDMGRLAVFCRLVRDGESNDVNTSLAVENPNPHYPQIWYDEHNMSNPYYDAHNWTVDD